MAIYRMGHVLPWLIDSGVGPCFARLINWGVVGVGGGGGGGGGRRRG